MVAATHRLRRARELRDPRLLMDTLTPCLVKDFGGAMNTTLYAQTHVGTKKAVEALFAEINRGLTWLMALDPGAIEEEARDEGDAEAEGETSAPAAGYSTTATRSMTKKNRSSKRRTGSAGNDNTDASDEDEDANNDDDSDDDDEDHNVYDDPLGEGGSAMAAQRYRRARSGSFGSDAFRKKRLAFFKAAQRSFGNTALLMSGGATLGIYHLGYLKALGARKRLPKVVSGTSAGAVLAAFMAVRTDDEVAATFADPELEEWWWQFGPTGRTAFPIYLLPGKFTAIEKKYYAFEAALSYQCACAS